MNGPTSLSKGAIVLGLLVAGILYAIPQLVTPASAELADPPVKRSKTPEGVEYGIWGLTENRPAPTLFVLATTIDGTLGDKYYRQSGNELAARGYLCVSIDLPCHRRSRPTRRYETRHRPCDSADGCVPEKAGAQSWPVRRE